jgi:hypothetical protein
MNSKTTSLDHPEAQGFRELTDAECADVSGGLRIRIPVGYDVDGNVVWGWTDV